MKLHLPKMLLTAVLAACCVPSAFAGWAAGYTDENKVADYTNGRVYYLNDLQSIDCVSGDQANANILYIQAGNIYSGTVQELSVKNGDSLIFARNTWSQTANRNLSGLIISTLNIAGTDESNPGAASLDVNALQDISLSSINGTLSSTNVSGTLTIGTAEATTASHSLGAVTVAQGGSLVLAGGTYTLGNGSTQSVQSAGEIVVKKNATLKFAGTDMAHYTNSTNITIDGGEWDGGTTRQSLCGSSVINLVNGTITSASNDDGSSKFGDGVSVVEFASSRGTLKSSGQSSITGGVALNWSRTLAVNVLDGTLSIDTIVSANGGGSITKSGDGTLKFTKMSANAMNHAFYTGNTTLQAGTIEYAIDKLSDSSTLDGSYTGTISGTGNIAKSGTGTVTLANVNNLDGEISVTGGTLNITTLSINKTMTVTQDGGTLNITTLNADMSGWAPSTTAKKYYEYVDGVATESTIGNGFLADKSTYQLFEGYAWTGTKEGYTTSNEGGNTYLTATGDISTNYHVTNTSTTVNTADVSGATGFSVGAGAKLNINSIIGADGITALGAGANINLSSGITLTQSSQVTVNDGASIKYTLNGAILDLSDTHITSEISSIDMKNGSTLQLHSTTNHLGNENNRVAINMSGDSAISLRNGEAGNVWADINIDGSGKILGAIFGNATVVKGTIKGNGSLLLGRSDSEWSNRWKIESRVSDNDTGKLSVTFDATDGKEGPSQVTLSNANTYSGGTTLTNGVLVAANESALGTGKVTVQGGTLKQESALCISDMDYTSGTVNNNGQNLTVTGTLKIADNTTMTIEGSGANKIGTLSLGAGLSADAAAVTTSGALTLGSISLDLSEYTTAGSYSLVGITGAGSINWTEDSWTQAGLADGLTANVGFNEARNGLSLTISEIVTPDVKDITTTVLDKSPIWDETTLTLTVGANLDGVGSVVIEGFEDDVLDKIFALEGMEANTMVGITLVGADGKGLSAVPVGDISNIGFQGNDGGIYYGQNVGDSTQYNVSYIPEPTTATLSLLALMGLAARRRRK